MKSEHEEKLRSGVRAWNDWRKGHLWFADPDLSGIWFRGDISTIDLRDADLSGVDFREVRLNGADLRDAKLDGANLEGADLTGCDLRGACLDNANFKHANLSGANLGPPDLLKRASAKKSWHGERTSFRKALFAGANLESALAEEAFAEMANFAGANLRGADFEGANLRGANLNGATCSTANFHGVTLTHSTMVAADLTQANLSDCSIYGVAAWDTALDGANQNNLVITPPTLSPIITDNIELAQFMYLLLNNKKVRDAIDTISTKLVLILGRFTEERKYVLDQIRDHIRSSGGIPVLFDFEKPQSRDITETVSTLAHLSRVVIADLTDAKCVPQELQATIPNLPSVRFQPICDVTDREYSMFEHFKRYPWVLPTIAYESVTDLMEKLSGVLEGLPEFHFPTHER